MKLNPKNWQYPSVENSFAPTAQFLSPSEAEILAALNPLSPDYPGVENWFLRKVMPGLRSGNRKIVRVERNCKLLAFGIAKKDADESKICTVRVMPEYDGRGFGLKVFDELLRWLDTSRPHLTVSDSSHRRFEKIFRHYEFELTSLRNGMYVPGKVEYLYNERVSLRLPRNRPHP